jgi:hypothetical protein
MSAPMTISCVHAGLPRRRDLMNLRSRRLLSPILPALLAAASALSVAADGDAGAGDTRAEDFRSAALQHGAAATDPDHAGIWKAATPRSGTMRGEFDNHDPVGLSAGARIKADCSINWVNPDSGKRYCFSSATSLVVFLETPHSYLARAETNWRRAQANGAR